jgi:hypothetical protein
MRDTAAHTGFRMAGSKEDAGHHRVSRAETALRTRAGLTARSGGEHLAAATVGTGPRKADMAPAARQGFRRFFQRQGANSSPSLACSTAACNRARGRVQTRVGKRIKLL